ncbi:MAG TPA: hypothetical protein VMW64_05950 [Dehalococcoidia bacterium]|nr:hypothetical protein [Dehalococcoidia bacterium]
MSYNRHVAELIPNKGHCSSVCDARVVANISINETIEGMANDIW